jgi:hypothetical protein
MAELESVLQKITDEQVFNDAPITTDLISAMMKVLNAVVYEMKVPKFVEFNASGSWSSPATASPAVLLYGIGGGGGGGGGGARGKGGGGGGGVLRLLPYEITPGQIYSVTIGSGGGGGSAGFNGNPGNPTIFGSNLVVCEGGEGGKTGTTADWQTRGGAGGSPGTSGQSGIGGGGGGGLRISEAPVSSGNGPSAAANSGAGGGGAGASTTAGGAGGSGKLTIIYFDSAL